MKSIATIIIFISVLSIHVSYGQEEQFERLETATLEGNVTNKGMLQRSLIEKTYFSQDGDLPTFEKGWLTGLIFGGLDAEGDLGVLITLNGQFGLISTIYDRTNNKPFENETYNRIWKIEQSEIVVLRELFEDGELEESDISEDILLWPARGNPFLNNGEISRQTPFNTQSRHLHR